MKTVPLIRALAFAVLSATAAQAQSSPAAKDLAALQGEWTLVSAMSNGQSAPDEALKDSRRTAHRDTTTVVVGGQLILKATFVLNPATKPKQVDYHVLGGMTPAGSILLGIYQLKGDTVRFCFASPSSPRPTEFVTHDGDRRTCSVWRRAKP